MAKRQISKQQKTRIEKRRATSLKSQARSEDSLSPPQQGLLIAHYGKRAEVESQGKVYQCYFRQNLQSLVVGDNVVFQFGPEHSGIIVDGCPRKSLLWRADDRGQQKPIAANLDYILIVTAPIPEPSTLLIDSYLVAAETLNIEPILIFHKIDLREEKNTLQPLIKLYQSISYPTIQSSVIDNHGLDDLKTLVTGKASVFVGQSGVGKSSLLQGLFPQEKIIVGPLHQRTQLGTHTTTTSRLYHLPEGGFLIDSPGIRDFCLWSLEENAVAAGFKEFRPYLGRCKFRDCRHLQEPDCAILAAVAKKKIHANRWQNYQRLLTRAS